VSGKRGNAHLVLGMPVNPTFYSYGLHKSDSLSAKSSITFEIDSIQIGKYTPGYEIQVRAMDQEFSNSAHSSIAPPTHLLAGFPLEPMKIHKIANTEYRFRLKQFFPDFTFQYSYPENRDTIPPRSPGITLNLITPGKEEVVTLRSDKHNLRKLDDVVGLGYMLEFFWTFSQDTLQLRMKDTSSHGNKILFAGKDKKIYWISDSK
jgi:hypothetical protein